MARVIAVANSKGGVGKTTLAVHLAAGLARKGSRTLLVDLDPQGRGTATAWLLGPDHASAAGVVDAMAAGRFLPNHVLEVPGRAGLWIAPATARLGADAARLASMMGSDLRLRRALEASPARPDYVVIDSPPGAGYFMRAAICAADHIVAPALASFLSTAGLSDLIELTRDARETLGVDTGLTGVVLFAADGRESITAETRDTIREALGEVLFRAEVRVSTAAKALPAHRATAWDEGADPRGLEDYGRVLDELHNRMAGRSRRK